MKYGETLAVRCTKKDLNRFKKWCEKVRKPYPELIRDVMIAAPEGRLRIDPIDYKKTMTGDL